MKKIFNFLLLTFLFSQSALAQICDKLVVELKDPIFGTSTTSSNTAIAFVTDDKNNILYIFNHDSEHPEKSTLRDKIIYYHVTDTQKISNLYIITFEGELEDESKSPVRIVFNSIDNPGNIITIKLITWPTQNSIVKLTHYVKK